MKHFRALVFSIALCCLAFSSAEASLRREVLQGPIPAEVVRVIDGDTVAVKAHIWIGQDIDISVRLAGIDAPEIKGKCDKERAMAQTAKKEVARLLKNGNAEIYNVQLEKYAGRVMADMKTPEGVDVSQHMLDRHLARPYHGEKRKPWCTEAAQF